MFLTLYYACESLGTLLKCRFWFGESGVGLEIGQDAVTLNSKAIEDRGRKEIRQIPCRLWVSRWRARVLQGGHGDSQRMVPTCGQAHPTEPGGQTQHCPPMATPPSAPNGWGCASPWWQAVWLLKRNWLMAKREKGENHTWPYSQNDRSTDFSNINAMSVAKGEMPISRCAQRMCWLFCDCFMHVLKIPRMKISHL